MAARSSAFDRDRFEDRQYDPVRAEVRNRLRIECGAHTITPSLSGAYFSHLVALALAKAAVIDYRAVFSAAARSGYESARVAFGQVAVGAAGVIRKR